VGVQKATIRNNVIYKWKAGLELRSPSGGLSLTGFSFTNNVVQEPSSSSEWLVSCIPGFSSSNLSFSGNKYFSGRPASSWFGISYVEKSHPQWVAATNEIGSQAVAVGMPDPTRNLATYHGSLGHTATMPAFLIEVRKQGKTNWRSEYTIQELLQYLREGYVGSP
jgi:alpha-glucosidase (family GH31 glycosyl hydrolase)